MRKAAGCTVGFSEHHWRRLGLDGQPESLPVASCPRNIVFPVEALFHSLYQVYIAPLCTTGGKEKARLRARHDLFCVSCVYYRGKTILANKFCPGYHIRTITGPSASCGFFSFSCSIRYPCPSCSYSRPSKSRKSDLGSHKRALLLPPNYGTCLGRYFYRGKG